jgi:DmsE family decaheme c-type cytochrome
MTRHWLVAVFALAVVLPGRVGSPQGEESPEVEPAPGTLEACGKCHRGRLATIDSSPHGSLDREGFAKRAGAASSCSACHGEVTEEQTFEGGLSEFARSQGCQAVFAFTEAESPAVKAQRCLTCHTRERPLFPQGRHALSGMDCTSCHDLCSEQSSGRWALQRAFTQYGSAIDVTIASATCWECHGDVVAEFDLNEKHRLEEGIVECISCHDPHRPEPRAHLGGFKQQQCAVCHVDKNGPFMFEHPPVRVEGCSACHTAHGSPNRHLLHFQAVAELCFGCHDLVPGFHSRFTLETQCTNCHSSIHGSFLDPRFLR